MALELGEASLHVCLREGEIVAATVKAPLGEGSAELIRAAIEPLGWLDEAALTALGRLSNGSSEASNGFVYGLIEGETREAFWVCPEAEFDALVWQPVHGGEKYHDSPTCSTMDVPAARDRRGGGSGGLFALRQLHGMSEGMNKEAGREAPRRVCME